MPRTMVIEKSPNAGLAIGWVIIVPKTYGNQWLESIAVSGDAHRGATGADKDGERGAWVGGSETVTYLGPLRRDMMPRRTVRT